MTLNVRHRLPFGRGLASTARVKVVAQIKLRVDDDTRQRITETVKRFHEAATWLGSQAVSSGVVRQYDLQRSYYADLRARFGLSAQMAVRAAAEVAASLKVSPTKRPVFRPLGAMPYDQRILSFRGDSHVSILTLQGRVVVPFVAGDHHRRLLSAGKRGQADLLCRKGNWYLLVSVDVAEPAPGPASGTLGVDLGIANLATDSDGSMHSGATTESVRARTQRLRDALQRCDTKSARRHLRRISGREARFRAHTNHVIAKAIVRKAQDTGRRLALEDLTGIFEGIRARGTVRGDQRARLGGWAFGQLRAFISYKAARAGVSVVVVDPRGTSTTCLACGYADRENRRSQHRFVCQCCGDEQHADIVGAVNIARRADVDRPIVADKPLGNRSQPDPPAGLVTSLDR